MVKNEKELGKLLRDVRIESPYLFSDITEKTGLSSRTIQNIEHGNTSTTTTLFKLVKMYGLKIEIHYDR